MMRFFFVFAFSLFSLGLSAQSLFFQPYYLLKKNEAIKINRTLQDKTGFLWFATNKGLFKFDGTTYRRFLAIDSLPDENVTALGEDSIGRVWAGFKNGKISIVDHNLITPFDPPEGMPKVTISDILFDKEGVLWFSTLNDGTYYYLNNRLYRLDDVNGMPDLFCYDLEEDAKGNIWVGTDGGAAICTRKENEVEIKVLNNASGLPDNIVKKILKGENDDMYLATEDAGLVIYHGEKFNSVLNDKWSYGSISDLLVIDDWMWVASAKGLLTIDLRSKERAPTNQLPGEVLSIYNDREGNVWIGSKTSLSRSLGKQLRLMDINASIVAVTSGKDGDLWYADDVSLYRNRGNGTLKPLAGTAFANKSVISLFTDPDGFIWAGLYGEGVLRIDPKNGTIKQLNKELRNGSVLNISGKDKTIWLATLGGVSEIKLNDNFLVKNYSTSDGLSTDYIYQVFVDSKSRVWFATDRNGVDMRDENGFHHFEENFDAKVVYGFAEDAAHRVWANVQDLGLFVFDEKKFQPFENQIWLHSTTMNALCSDGAGRLIAANDLGLDIFNPTKKNFHFFDEQSGAGNRIANLNAISKNDKGEIFIGTNHGLLIYSPQQNLQESPQVLIDQIRINDQIVDLTKTESLSYDQNNIKIDFLGFWYQNPTGLNFVYQLDHYDPEWIDTRGNSATYSKLPPGDYTFRLKVSDSNDFSNSAEAKMHFVIRPPFYKTNFFYALVALVLVVIVYFFIKLREKQLIAEKRELEIKVRERTSEIEQKTHEIQAQAEEIRGINENLEQLVRSRTAELEHKNKAIEEYAFINAHQLRAPVASILGLIHLMQKLDLGENEKEFLTHLNDSAKKLDVVVSSITEAIERGDFMNPPLTDD
ncbi:MAG TPA: two-component regulator propeller domain-containing protein [Cyclobacteriaceae bacterium]|nr:two-component regulator propeller domain-containing protein [Cyclobacteriaceae bacterium]